MLLRPSILREQRILRYYRESKVETCFPKRQVINNQHEISGLGYLATEAAYRSGEEWLSELKELIEKHIN